MSILSSARQVWWHFSALHYPIPKQSWGCPGVLENHKAVIGKRGHLSLLWQPERYNFLFLDWGDGSLVDEGDIDSALSSICVFLNDLKELKLHTWDSGVDKTFQVTTSWSGCRVQGWVQVWAPAAMPVIWQSLYTAIPEENQSFWLQNQWQSSWGCSPAQLGLVRWARSNTGCFQVSSSPWGQWPACLRKMCYHSCNTESFWESKKF